MQAKPQNHAELSVMINVAPVANGRNTNPMPRRVRNVKYSIISNSDAVAVAILEFLHTGGKGIRFQH